MLRYLQTQTYLMIIWYTGTDVSVFSLHLIKSDADKLGYLASVSSMYARRILQIQ